MEVEVSGLGSRRGINNKIESILKRDWESVEVAFENKKVQSNATNEFKSKRDKFQSTRFSSQLPNLPVPVEAGFQLMVLFKSNILSRFSVTFINQESNG